MAANPCPLCDWDRPDPVFTYPRYPFYIKPVRREDLGKVPTRPLSLLLCTRCGFVYQDADYPAGELERIYEEIYESYHSPVRGGIGGSLAEAFLGFLEGGRDLERAAVLEIGCFDGYLLSLLRDRHGCRVKGCDPSPGATIARDLGVEVVQEYFSPGLFRDRYDLVILRGVLEHVPDPAGFLAMAGEVLAGGGSLAIEVPNLEYTLEKGVLGDLFHEHLSYFTGGTLEGCLGRAGFSPSTRVSTGPYLRGIFRASPAGRGAAGAGADGEEVARTRRLFREYNRTIRRLVAQLQVILEPLTGARVYLYGAGGHTTGLLARTAEFLRPAGVIDGDPAKAGKYIPGFGIPVFPREVLRELDPSTDVIIVSSKIFQEEIVEGLAPDIRRGFRVITLYDNVEYVKTPTSDQGKDG
jgi:SAM-dependent methyltransferase